MTNQRPDFDVLFTGGAVFDGTRVLPVGTAVGVIGDRIAAVLPEREAAARVGGATRVIDLDGRLLAPGFQDTHLHPISAGVEALQCDLTGAASAREAIWQIAAYAAAQPEEPWVLGGGWTMEHFPGGSPTRGLIDAIVPDRPVLLHSRDHHSTWANSAAIRAAGISAATPDPADGRIEREADGAPAGTFHEGAGELFAHVRPQPSDELMYRGLLHAQAEMLSLGITGWQDAIVGSRSAAGPVPGSLEAYLRAIAEGTLQVHVVGCQWWARDAGFEQVEELVRVRDELQAQGLNDRLDLGTVKMMVDGVAENYTASMLDPYLDADGCVTQNHGISFVDPEMMREAVVTLDAAGMQVHFHALGDRAVRDALDAVQAARETNGRGGARHHLAHLQVVAEADVPRFSQLAATANLQMLWAAHEAQLDTLTLPFLREGAEARHYPFGELYESGAQLAAGSDWPVSSADPLAAMQIGVTRVEPGSVLPPLGGAAQRLQLETAFAAYTSGSAYINRREHDTGHLRADYLANLVVIAPNPFTLTPEDLGSARVTNTWVAGQLAYERS